MSAARKFNRTINRHIAHRIEQKRRVKALEFIARDITRRNARIGQGPTGTQIAQGAGVSDVVPTVSQETAASVTCEGVADGAPVARVASATEG